MNLYSASQLKERDIYTAKSLGLTSFELMTKAAKALSKEITKILPNQDTPIHIFCGNGNNGGDGMLIAKQLRNEFLNVHVYECGIASKDTIDYSLAEQEAKSISNINFTPIKKAQDLPKIVKGIAIDALLGIGINRPLEGHALEIVEYLNGLTLPIISIDMPSGMPVEGILNGQCVKASYTLTVEDKKASFFYEENNGYFGNIIEVPIGLSKDFDAQSIEKYIVSNEVEAYLTERKKFSHKGDYGHLLLVCGTKGMAGAAILSGSSALRSGVGLVTMCIDQSINDVVQVSIPEAMTINQLNDLDKYDCIGLGCGLGMSAEAKEKVDCILSTAKNLLLIDADGLNVIVHNNWLHRIPKGTILTPHPKEFDRLFGGHTSHYNRCQTQKLKSKELGIFIVLKTAHSSITTPDGMLYFNTTGNAGMAKAGSGDVLLGYMAGMAAMLKDPYQAAIAAVYLHGLAGDKARQMIGSRSMKSGDIIEQFMYIGF